MEDCEFCRGEYSHTVLKEYENWQVQLFLNQYYLGRCLVKLKEHKVDLSELSEEERNEFFEKVLPDIREAVDELFSPDLYNYCSLGNDCRHFHFHIIPRYSSSRDFEGRMFEDENWNSHYKPYPTDFKLEDEVFEKLKENISRELE